MGRRAKTQFKLTKLGRDMVVESRGKDAEHRLLTILVVDIVDSTKLARRLDQEDLAELLNSFHEICGRVVNRFEGRVAKDLGDGFSAHFGWPECHERDAECAVLAGLDLIEAVKTIPSPSAAEALRIHIGIATGEVLVGDVRRGRNAPFHEAFGELPSLAARIQACSSPDTVLLSPETYQLVRHKFVCVAAGRRKLKGFGQPIELYQVIGARGLSLEFDARRASGLTPLIGRATELDLLKGEWQQAKAGRDRTVLLTGEPGIGKSRLCAEFQLSLDQQDPACFSFQCSPLHKATPLYPITKSIAQIAGISVEDPPDRKLEKLEAAFNEVNPARPEAVALLATHLGASKVGDAGQELPLGESRRRRRTLNSLLINFLLAPAKRKPVLIVVEDVHWMDPTTAEFVEMLIERVRGHPVLTIITSRPQFSPSWENARLVTLDRLTRDQTVQFIRIFTSSSPLSDDLISHLVESSDGNPLYIEELTTAVIGGRGKPRTPGGADKSGSNIPSTLRESLLSRIDRTSSEARELIQVCAVLGRRFSRKLISAVVEMDSRELETTLAELVREGLLFTTVQSTDDVEYAFKHALVQATAYSLILREKRRRLHLRCAMALEAHFPSIRQHDPGVLGLHYEHADNAEAALPCIFAAARSAIDRSALLEATSYLQRGLVLLEKLPQSETRDGHELSFRSALGRVYIFSKGWADPSVKEQYERALLLAKQLANKKSQIPLEWALTTYYLLRGDINKAVSGGRRVLGLAELVGDQNFLLVAHSALSIYDFYSGNFVGAVNHKEEALRFYRENATEELRKSFGTDRRLQALRGAALSHWCIGNHQLAIELDHEQRSRAEHHVFDYTYSLTISCILHSLGRNSQMMRSFSESAISIAQEHGFGFLEANAANFRAIALMLQNPSEPTLREFDETVKKYQAAGNQMGISSMFAIVAEQCGNIGLSERGLEYIDRALGYVRRSGEQFAQSDLYRAKGLLLRNLKMPGEAQQCLARALLIARKQKAKTWELAAAVPLARMLCGQGEFKKASRLLQPLCQEFAGSEFVSGQLIEAKNLLDQCHSGENPSIRSRPAILG